MFQVGDIIQYGNVGACRVADIVTGIPNCGGRRMYVIKPLYYEGTIYAPIDSDKVFMRPIVSRQEAERIIGAIPDMMPRTHNETQTVSQLVEYYEGCIRTHECTDLVALTMFIYGKKKAAEQAKRKFGSVDEKYMRRAEDLLYGELAAALGIARNEVPHYIERKVGALPVTIA